MTERITSEIAKKRKLLVFENKKRENLSMQKKYTLR